MHISSKFSFLIIDLAARVERLIDYSCRMMMRLPGRRTVWWERKGYVL
jgi:hypothetical protein